MHQTKNMIKLMTDQVISDLAAGRKRSRYGVYHRDLDVILATGYVAVEGHELRLTVDGVEYARSLNVDSVRLDT
jgi:hypothetical protein